MDAVEAAADLFVLHRIGEPLPEMKAQADVLHRAAEQTEQRSGRSAKLRRDDLEPYWVEINSLENEGDKFYRRAVADLFSGDHRAMDVLRWKEVIETLEEALDGLENVANVDRDGRAQARVTGSSSRVIFRRPLLGTFPRPWAVSEASTGPPGTTPPPRTSRGPPTPGSPTAGPRGWVRATAAR